jgi:hypothetical protein
MAAGSEWNRNPGRARRFILRYGRKKHIKAVQVVPIVQTVQVVRVYPELSGIDLNDLNGWNVLNFSRVVETSNGQSLNGSVSCAGGFFSCRDDRTKLAISASSQRI